MFHHDLRTPLPQIARLMKWRKPHRRQRRGIARRNQWRTLPDNERGLVPIQPCGSGEDAELTEHLRVIARPKIEFRFGAQASCAPRLTEAGAVHREADAALAQCCAEVVAARRGAGRGGKQRDIIERRIVRVEVGVRQQHAVQFDAEFGVAFDFGLRMFFDLGGVNFDLLFERFDFRRERGERGRRRWSRGRRLFAHNLRLRHFQRRQLRAERGDRFAQTGNFFGVVG